MGIPIALDDIGEGHSNYRMILDCRPEFFKIDKYFVQGSHRDSARRAVLQSVVTLAANFGSPVIAEGVEELADLDLVTSVGINFV